MNAIRIFLIFIITLISHLSICAQKEGDTWVIGYTAVPSSEESNFGIMYPSFKDGNFSLTWDRDAVLNIAETSANICDKNGDPILWTNGMEIFGRDGLSVVDTIAYSPGDLSYWNWFTLPDGPIGFPYYDGAIILPVPETENDFLIIYHFIDQIGPAPPVGVEKYLQTKVRQNTDGSMDVIYKDSLVIEYNYLSGNLSATRHANGRDWWILATESIGKKYFLFLLDTTGVHLYSQGEVDYNFLEGLGRSEFSYHGNYFNRLDNLTIPEGQVFSIFDFDRCTGELISKFQSSITYGAFNSVAFSPSDQYIYANDNTHLWQWDLLANDIEASKILVDTFDGFIQPGWLSMKFGPMIQGPDNRIYVVPPQASSRYIHVIDRPNEKGKDCKFLQHHIELPKWNARSAPNIPNYRLGPIDGSPCDTLGIDNKATSRWRWEADDPSDPLTIRFTDLAFYEPDTWAWTFDDGHTSDISSPVHTFPDYGLYHVCQTVENEYQRDSTCKWIELLPTVLTDDPTYTPFTIHPNPFTDELQIKYNGNGYSSGTVMITDLHGRVVMQTGEIPIPITLEMPDLPSGMYICTIKDEAGRMTTMKVVRR